MAVAQRRVTPPASLAIPMVKRGITRYPAMAPVKGSAPMATGPVPSPPTASSHGMAVSASCAHCASTSSAVPQPTRVRPGRSKSAVGLPSNCRASGPYSSGTVRACRVVVMQGPAALRPASPPRAGSARRRAAGCRRRRTPRRAASGAGPGPAAGTPPTRGGSGTPSGPRRAPPSTGTTLLNHRSKPARHTPDVGASTSRTPRRPPGRRTRAASASVAARSVKLRRAYPQTSPSNESSVKGSAHPSDSTRGTPEWLAASIPALRSVPTTV